MADGTGVVRLAGLVPVRLLAEKVALTAGPSAAFEATITATLAIGTAGAGALAETVARNRSYVPFLRAALLSAAAAVAALTTRAQR